MVWLQLLGILSSNVAIETLAMQNAKAVPMTRLLKLLGMRSILLRPFDFSEHFTKINLMKFSKKVFIKILSNN